MNSVDILIEQIGFAEDQGEFDPFVFFSALEDSISSIAGLSYRNLEIQSRHMNALNEVRRAYEDFSKISNLCNTFSPGNSAGYVNQLKNSFENFLSMKNRLQPISDHLAEKDIEIADPLNRDDFANATDKLIQEISEWKIDEYPKRSLQLSLQSVRRIIDEGELFSDSQLRRRIKEVVADFQVEFVKMDKEYDTHLQSIMRWAKPAWSIGSGLIAIAATSSDIAGLIEYLDG